MENVSKSFLKISFFNPQAMKIKLYHMVALALLRDKPEE